MTPAIHLVMHGAAIKKHAAASDIAAIAGLDGDAFDDALAWTVATGRVLEVDGKYMLSPAAQMIVQSEYSRFCSDLRADTGFIQAYERFEVINRDLKAVVTRWQTMEVGGKRVANDHSDADYDDAVIGDLGDLHERFVPVLAELVAAAPRLGVYQSKLAAALDKAEDGDTEWVSDATIDSYHTVWFELHEDLLRTLGRQREE